MVKWFFHVFHQKGSIYLKPQGIKSLGLDIDVHKAIKRRAADDDRQMKDLVREAWEYFSAAAPALTDSNILNKSQSPPPPPPPELVPSLAALARKLGAAKAELEGIIARQGGIDESAGGLLADTGRGKANARALIARLSGNQGVPGGIEGTGEEAAGGDRAAASAGNLPRSNRRAKVTGGGLK